uniref:Serpentine Receptor, class Z n=1 Tax=Caenorhabditis tropicalis TaxID=1561998 RepID=A0A1I7TH38_9PELO
MDYDDNLFSTNETLSYDQQLTGLISVFSVPITLLIFPFYRHVYRINMDRDKTTPLFKITQHFHKVLKIICILYLLILFIFVIMGILQVGFQLDATPIAYLIALIYVIPMFISQNNEFLLGILAIQRFILYFFPGTEKYISLSENGLSRLVNSIYLTLILVPLLAMLSFLHPGLLGFILGHFELCKGIAMACVGFVFGFSFFATLFYIPILISIRKLSHLSSAKLNKPQRYILWQLVVMTMVKCISMTTILFTSDWNFISFYIQCRNIDGICFPLAIQLSYLGCNKRNLDALAKSLNDKWMRTLCCPKYQVTPHQNVYSINSGALNS